MLSHPAATNEAILQAIDTLKNAIGSAQEGLPEEIFQFVSSLTPLINVDLLIRDEAGRTLLTWRHDLFYGPGWHVPGGIIRFKETSAARIAAVAAKELGARVCFNPRPLCQHEIVHTRRDIRGHFISLLYVCRLQSVLDERRCFVTTAPRHGDWAWHTHSPDNLIKIHEVYRRFIDADLTAYMAQVAQVSTEMDEEPDRSAYTEIHIEQYPCKAFLTYSDI